MVLAKTKAAITTGIVKCIDIARYVAARMIELFGVLCGIVSTVLDTMQTATICVVTTFDVVVYYLGLKIADFLDILCGIVSMVLAMTKTAITSSIARFCALIRYSACEDD